MRIVREYYESVVSRGEIERLSAFVADDYVEVFRGERHELGRDGAAAHIRGVRRTYPDLTLRVERQIAEGDWVVSVVSMTGTHEGDWMGIAPTHQRVTTTAVNVDRVVDGLIVEHGGAANLLMPLLEIGAVRRVDRTDRGSRAMRLGE